MKKLEKDGFHKRVKKLMTGPKSKFNPNKRTEKVFNTELITLI
jgi:hypothetical protein